MRSALALLLLLASAAPSGAARTDIVAVDDFIDAPRALFGRTRAAVEGALGPPLSVRPTTVQASPTAAAEPADLLAYAGLVVVVSGRSAPVRRVEITEPRWTLPSGLNVGTPRAQVEATLGEPQLVSDASVLYLDADGFPNTVEFHFRAGHVRRIEWSYAAAD
ncbi:MAG TPA: hypothetical protein VMQ51_17330 [Candidatus Binatia bacterium]|nr:hypothetical protein [Candidatus Binatia bacterium]